MPKVEQYGALKVDPTVARRPRANAVPFRNTQRDESSAIVKGVQDVANAFAKRQQDLNETSAEESVIGFERARNNAFFNGDKAYFRTAGRDAVTGAPIINQSLLDLQQEYGESLNPEARKIYDRVTNSHVTRGQQSIMQHSTKGAQEYKLATINSKVENALENGALFNGNDDDLNKHMGVGLEAVKDKMDMLGIYDSARAEEIQSFASAYASTAIIAAADQDVERAEELLAKYDRSKALESPDRKKAKDAITKRKDKIKKQNVVAEVNITANKMFTKHGGDINSALEDLSKVRPDIQAKVRREFFYMADAQRKGTSQANKQTVQEAIEAKKSGKLDTYNANNPDKVGNLTPAQRNSIAKSGKVVTPRQIGITGNTIFKSGDKEKMKEFLERYGDLLSDRDIKTYQTFVDAPDTYKPLSMSLPSIKAYTAGKSKSVKAEFENVLSRWYLESHALTGNLPTPAEVNDMVTESIKDTNEWWPGKDEVYKRDDAVRDMLRLPSLGIALDYGIDQEDAIKVIDEYFEEYGVYPDEEVFQDMKVQR